MTGDMDAVIKSAREGCEPMNVGPDVIFLPSASGGVGRLVNLEPFYPKPSRQTGTITVFDAASFNQVVAANSRDQTSIYLDRNPISPKIVAILNGSGKDGSGWSDFRVQIALRETPAWVRWKAISGSLMPQMEFAAFIEENLEDIVEPSGASMLELATHLEASRSGNVKSVVRLPDGAYEIAVKENIDAKVGAARIAVPEKIMLGLAPFQGVKTYAVPARFRYRLNDGTVTMGVKLMNTEKLIDAVVEDVIAKIERSTNISVLDGIAPDPQKVAGLA